jgi:hypothetical protein
MWICLEKAPGKTGEGHKGGPLRLYQGMSVVAMKNWLGFER